MVKLPAMEQAVWQEVDVLDETERGAGGLDIRACSWDGV